MTDANPTVPWRFGEGYETTNFVTPKNIAVRNAAIQVYNADENKCIENVADFICDKFYYPLDDSGNPLANAKLGRLKKGLLCVSWDFDKYLGYTWLFPNEVLGQTKSGICIDTANLAVSLLRACDIDAWVALGTVKSSKDDTILGYHAWAEFEYKGEPHICETTIHQQSAVTIIRQSEVYNRLSNWAQQKNLYYAVDARYREDIYSGVTTNGGQMPMLLGLPAKRVQVMGINRAHGVLMSNPKQIEREWRREEKYLRQLMVEAYMD